MQELNDATQATAVESDSRQAKLAAEHEHAIDKSNRVHQAFLE
jgi:hypothetical protein